MNSYQQQFKIQTEEKKSVSEFAKTVGVFKRVRTFRDKIKEKREKNLIAKL